MLRSTLLFALCFAPSVMAQDWRIEEIGSGTKPELAVDSNGQPHIAYMIEALQGGVIFASRAGGSWPVETVAEGYFYGPLDLAVDEDDRPHIAYHDHQGTAFDPDLGDATYAFNGGAGWTVEKIAHPGHDGWDNSIAIGPEGEVRGQQEAGQYAVRWDGLDRADRAAATGLYLLKMRAGDGQATGKMLLLR